MTNPISSHSPDPNLAIPAAPTSPRSGARTEAGAASGVAGGPAQVESVTLTSSSQTSSALLDAARAAVGIDTRSVQALRAAIVSESYGVPPGQLATSIISALAAVKE